MERESTSRLTLDDVCGKEPKNFKKDRLFQNHYRTHAEEKFVCKECPSVWSGGPENTFNTKKQLSSHMHEYHKSHKDCDQCSKSFSCSTKGTYNNLTFLLIMVLIHIYWPFTEWHSNSCITFWSIKVLIHIYWPFIDRHSNSCITFFLFMVPIHIYLTLLKLAPRYHVSHFLKHTGTRCVLWNEIGVLYCP